MFDELVALGLFHYLSYVVYGWLVIKLYKWNLKRREQKFLKAVSIKFPGSTVMYTSVSSTDAETLDKLKERIDAL